MKGTAKKVLQTDTRDDLSIPASELVHRPTGLRFPSSLLAGSLTLLITDCLSTIARIVSCSKEGKAQMVVLYWENTRGWHNPITTHAYAKAERQMAELGKSFTDLMSNPSESLWIVPNSDYEWLENLKLVVEF